ncbi:hypothetical protein K523DRAFT_122361 [Schizophyllum commune Tattone D]|nr:hypothetical protein K523DRAFT_122361 [Schizophyllum commune Tattone D]
MEMVEKGSIRTGSATCKQKLLHRKYRVQTCLYSSLSILAVRELTIPRVHSLRILAPNRYFRPGDSSIWVPNRTAIIRVALRNGTR